MVMKGREEGTLAAERRTGKGAIVVPQSMLRALGVKLAGSKPSVMEEVQEGVEPNMSEEVDTDVEYFGCAELKAWNRCLVQVNERLQVEEQQRDIFQCPQRMTTRSDCGDKEQEMGSGNQRSW